MEVIDLTQFYVKAFIQGEDPTVYTHSYPAFFRHYFDYWGSKQIEFVRLTEEKINQKKNRITTSIQKIQNLLDHQSINTSQIKVVLFVGQNVSNGHAFLDANKGIAFIAIESYNSTLYSDVFCAHEISHAIHYSINSDFYFKNHSEKEKFSRQLICEGIATYMTKEVLKVDEGVALWADLLTNEQFSNWVKKCESKSQEINDYCHEHFNSNDMARAKGLFYFEDLDDPFKSRGGYWFGLKMIEELMNQEIRIMDLLKMHREDMENKIIRQLKKHIT